MYVYLFHSENWNCCCSSFCPRINKKRTGVEGFPGVKTNITSHQHFCASLMKRLLFICCQIISSDLSEIWWLASERTGWPRYVFLLFAKIFVCILCVQITADWENESKVSSCVFLSTMGNKSTNSTWLLLLQFTSAELCSIPVLAARCWRAEKVSSLYLKVVKCKSHTFRLLSFWGDWLNW